MQLELFDFETERHVKSEVDEIPTEFLTEISKRNLSDEQLQRQIDNLPLSADQKVLAAKIASFTISAGKRIVKIGRRILELAL